MAKIDKLLDPERAAPLVRAYYKGVEGPDGAVHTFAGSRFETLARGGHRADAADEITYDDLGAVTLLGVEVPPNTALRLLGPDARAVSALLRSLPRLQRISGVEVEALDDPDQPARQLWDLLRSMDGMGPAKVSKLMARKRPHLIPVYDGVVGQVLGPVDGHWRRVHAIATDHAHTLAAIRREAGVASNVSLLRVLDVTIWMRSEGAREAKAATGVDLLASPSAKKPKKKAKKSKAAKKA
jgi:hypothetical protein